jgi:integral membrane protein
MSALSTFRTVARLEGMSFLVLLFIAMPIKYGFHDARAVRLVGGLHGVLFLAFLTALLRVALEQNWSWRLAVRVFALSLVPFGFMASTFRREFAQSSRISLLHFRKR